MTDITARLRSRLWQQQGDTKHWLLRDEAADEIERLSTALHQIGLCSQNSMSSKEECGRIARAALVPLASAEVSAEASAS